VARIRLIHPFPSALDGLVCGAIAIVAGGSAVDGARVGFAMFLLQAGIGATNDLVDAPRDAGRKPGKPIPSGLVSRRAAVLVALVSFAGGLGAAVPSGLMLAALAIVVIAIGLAYDLRLKGTAWSWVPFAVGIPILPLFGWLGVRPSLPAAFAFLVPAAITAGAALAIGNGLVDVHRDRSAGIASVATRLGEELAWRIQLALLVGVWLAAMLSAAVLTRRFEGVLLVGALGTVAPLAAVLGRRGGPRRLERAWEAEALGMGVLAVAWSALAFP
jgi:4-hydroxybenzoate polyprenyltransferase